MICHTEGMRYWLAPLGLALLGLACAQPQSFTEGAICLDAVAVADFADGDELQLEIILDDCMACPKDFRAGCQVSREGDEITVHAHGEYSPRRGPCDSCIALKTACNIGGLPQGTYTIRSGDNTRGLTLPAPAPVTRDPLCAGD